MSANDMGNITGKMRGKVICGNCGAEKQPGRDHQPIRKGSCIIGMTLPPRLNGD